MKLFTVFYVLLNDMKHDRIERLIQKSLDFETNAEEERTLHLHLSKCSDCQRLYQELVQTGKSISDLIEFYPQQGFNDRVLSKLGYRKVFAWKKVGAVFAGAWLTSLLVMAFSPWFSGILTKFFTSIPALVRIFDKTQLFITTFSHILAPFAKNSFSLTLPTIGLVLSIIIIYLFGKTISPVRKLERDIKSPSKRQNFLTG